MKHVLSRAGGCTVLLGALAGFSGCTDEETGLFIVGNMSLEAPDCIARPEGTATLISRAILDVALRPDYTATLLVGSQLTPRGDKENLRTETAITTITGAEVQLFTDTGEADSEFTVPASGVIRPDGSEDAGFGVVIATLIPAATGAALAESLTSRSQIRTRVAQVKVFGETIGGVEVESAELTYVIRVCEGCLIDYPADSLDENGNCTQPTDMADDEIPCRPGQDDSIDCRVCAGNPFCASPFDQ